MPKSAPWGNCRYRRQDVFCQPSRTNETKTGNGQCPSERLWRFTRKIWNNRPDMPDAPTFIYDLKYAGKSCEEKIASIRTEIQKQGTDGLFISALDEIAWTLNLRGSDVHCNPVIISYLLITQII